MSHIPEDVKYTAEHEWVRIGTHGVVTMGITDFAQDALGDIVYIQLPKVGETIVAGKVCGEVESTKSVSEIYAPLNGKVAEVNGELERQPELLNSDPYGAGWIAKISIESESELQGLLSSDDYRAQTA